MLVMVFAEYGDAEVEMDDSLEDSLEDTPLWKKPLTVIVRGFFVIQHSSLCRGTLV
jgi:hypothetical protein